MKIYISEAAASRKSRRNPMTKTVNERLRYLPDKIANIDWKRVKTDPVDYAQDEKVDVDILISALEEMDRVYYNVGESLIPDSSYDLFRSAVNLRDPEHPYFNQVGTAVATRDKRKVLLPHYMPSLDKIRPNTSETDRWYKAVKNTDWMVMDKLDGVSILLVYIGNSFLGYTRGDGTTGQNVTDNLKEIDNIPKSIPGLKGNQQVAVRGELIMTREKFESVYKAKDNSPAHGSARFSNSRALIVGTVNRLHESKQPHNTPRISNTTHQAPIQHNPLKDSVFIAYELIQDKSQTTQNYTPHEQLSRLKRYGFSTVANKVLNSIDDTILSAILANRKQKCRYDIDGLVVFRNKPYTRTHDDRPDYAKAFKDNTLSEQKVVTVKDVLWNVTRTGVIAPRVMIEPTHLSGSTITYLTGFNAFFIENGFSFKDRHNPNNKSPKPIGPGAKIRIVKSGDVIPYIMEVVKAAAEPKLPSIGFAYDGTGVNIVVDTSSKVDFESDFDPVRQRHVETFLHFFRTIGALHIGDAIVNKMLDTGNHRMLTILRMSPQDFEEKLDLSPLMANKIHKSIHDSIKSASLPTLGSATGIFGRGIGINKLDEIFSYIPNILSLPLHSRQDISNLEGKIANLHGFSINTAEQIVQSLPKFKAFIQALKLPITHNQTSATTRNPVSQKLNGVCVVFSKVRDKDLEKAIEENSGKVVNSVTSAVTHVIVGSPSDTSSKIAKAKERGLPVWTIRQFKSNFSL